MPRRRVVWNSVVVRLAFARTRRNTPLGDAMRRGSETGMGGQTARSVEANEEGMGRGMEAGEDVRRTSSEYQTVHSNNSR